jgi:hypothetical protein
MTGFAEKLQQAVRLMLRCEIVGHVSVARTLNPSEPAARVNDARFVALQ